MKTLRVFFPFWLFATAVVFVVSLVNATPFQPGTAAFKPALRSRRVGDASPSALRVDLGYEVYEGVANDSTGLHTWKGIRYAAPPTGQYRWQAPRAPEMNKGSVLQADALPQRCPQSPDAPLAPVYNSTGSEDCLFLSVYAPPDASNLPVLVWIHGGGYGAGSGNQDLSHIINENDNGFVGVAIQYRLGAFGFLSSDEVYRNGVVNAGILDQHFALQWVHRNIGLFGGDATRVTIAGESAGGGSVMLQAMAYGGSLGTSLFQNVAAASPYLPMQYGYADWMPSQSYYAFAQAVGCFPGIAAGNRTETIFKCLVSKDTESLQNASARISASGKYGTWGFLPVTDGLFVQQLPSQQLLKKQVNGVRILSGNNANEGPSFTIQNINTEDAFLSWLRLTFPLFTDDDIAKLLSHYPSTDASVDPADPKFATLGDSGLTALIESQFGTGQQQRADNLYAETTFVCPSYWVAEAFSGNGRTAFKYQYSVPAAQHGIDVSAYFGPANPNISPQFQNAFMRIWGNFIMHNDPSISDAVANTTGTNPAGAWPVFSPATPYQVNLNETGGTPYSVIGTTNTPNVTQFREPGLVNDFRLVDAYSWEGGRGMRCDFWRSVGAVVPE